MIGRSDDRMDGSSAERKTPDPDRPTPRPPDRPYSLMKHLYLHVPFCLRRCSYCDFAVHATRRPPVADWLWAMSEELRLRRELNEIPGELHLSTVYVGGG